MVQRIHVNRLVTLQLQLQSSYCQIKWTRPLCLTLSTLFLSRPRLRITILTHKHLDIVFPGFHPPFTGYNFRKKSVSSTSHIFIDDLTKTTPKNRKFRGDHIFGCNFHKATPKVKRFIIQKANIVFIWCISFRRHVLILAHQLGLVLLTTGTGTHNRVMINRLWQHC